MPLSFPSNPSTNQTSTQNGRVFRWSGSAWEFASTSPADDARWNLFLPSAPTSVTATGGNAQAVVSWTAPTVLSVTPITDYVVQYSSNSGSTWTTFSDGTSTATSATVTALSNGTAYTFRVAATNGVGTGAYSTASSAVTPQSGDALFGSVSLLLHADGTGSTFVDSSAYGRTVTANGSATQSADQSKFGGKSGYFNGSSSLQLAYSSGFVFDGDFTVECWVNFSSHAAYGGIMACATSGGGVSGWQVIFNNNTDNILVETSGGVSFSSSSALTANVWNHVALVRSGSTVTLYLNGTSAGTGTTSSTIDSGGNALYIAAERAGTSRMTGYIDEVRITKASRYAANFTPATAAFPEAVPGTDPLFSSVQLLLHADGTGSTFTDSSSFGRAVTASGGATQSATQSKFGGKSAAFPDSPLSYLTIPRASALEIGADDFTMEWWLYPTAYPSGSSPQYNSLLYSTRGTASVAGLIATMSPAGKLSLFADGGSQTWGIFSGTAFTTSTIPLNAWTHVALTRSGSTWRGYFNGQLEVTVTQSATPNTGTGGMYVGGDPSGERFVGYIDEFRFTKGVARYTNATITVPTAAFPDS